jgi:dTDP-4-dehydrorhamnose 3,5-epimerase
MEIYTRPTSLEGVVVIETASARDVRGFFIESYNWRNYAALGIRDVFVQDNHSRSSMHVLRGLHYQDMTAPQAKLVRCIVGAIWDVAVDVRFGSPTFGRWVGIELTANNMRQVFIPAGFAHGFVALTQPAEIVYKCTNYYAPAAEGGIAWDDPDLAITWPVDSPILSERDRRARSWREYLADPAFRCTPDLPNLELVWTGEHVQREHGAR